MSKQVVTIIADNVIISTKYQWDKENKKKLHQKSHIDFMRNPQRLYLFVLVRLIKYDIYHMKTWNSIILHVSWQNRHYADRFLIFSLISSWLFLNRNSIRVWLGFSENW